MAVNSVAKVLAYLFVATILQPLLCFGQDIKNETFGDFEPINPDVTVCSPIYGSDISLEGCKLALDKIYPGRIPKLVTVTRDQYPLYWADDDEGRPTCKITVDLAGFSRTTSKRIWSNTLRDRIQRIMSSCIEKALYGGFITYGVLDTGNGMSKMTPYPKDRPTFVDSPPMIVISITPPRTPNLRPGATDPEVPKGLHDQIYIHKQHDMALPSTKNKQVELMNQLRANIERMEQGGKVAWWDTQHFEAISPTHVEFDCDARLGDAQNLRPRDCEDASFGFIGKGYAPEIVKGGKALAYKNGQCAFKAESVEGSVKTRWDLLRAGADLLMSKCLTGQGAQGIGGKTRYVDAGSSQGYAWPKGLVISMGNVGLVGEGEESTPANATAAVGVGASDGIQPVQGEPGFAVDSTLTS